MSALSVSALPGVGASPRRGRRPGTELPTVQAQAERLIELGVHELAGIPADEVRAWTGSGRGAGLLVVGSSAVPPSKLVPLLSHLGRPGFVVADLDDLDRFAPLPSVRVPAGPAYLVSGPARGDQLAGWSPDEAQAAIVSTGRTPLTINEGLSWLLQCPGVLERSHCFMTLGSRRRHPGGDPDRRALAIWISNGSGRDGLERRHAPKVGWCWAGNRHTWLGFASAEARRAVRR